MKISSILHPIRAITNYRRYKFFTSKEFPKLMEKDLKRALEIMWKVQTRTDINWDNPQTLNEKNVWLEAMSDTSLWTEYSDKFLVREHIKELGLERILNKCYGVWTNADDIDFSTLPDQFVLKCNHDCASTKVITDKSQIDEGSIRAFYREKLSKKYGYETCEPHYTKIKPRVMAEELIENTDLELSPTSLVDYKFFCCDGIPQCCMVCYNRSGLRGTFDLYELNPWQKMKEAGAGYNLGDNNIPEPARLREMIEIAHILSKDFPFIRIDLYNTNGRIYFGELTFTPHGAIQDCFTERMQYVLGSRITLPKLSKNIQ